MAYVPNTDTERQEMLNTIGVSSFEELISVIPQEVRLKGELNLPSKLSEYEIVKLLNEYSSKNKTASNNICFMGGGSYDHYIPAIVGFVLDRPEFKTAYTPYQAEVSQGTLQVMYEFQSMICALTGMDVSNASLYDGGSALAEACLLSFNHNKKTEIVYAGSVNPHYTIVAESVGAGRKLTFKSCIGDDGTCDLELLRKTVTNKTSAVIVQQPNAYGNLEEVLEIEKIAHSNGAIFVVVIDPISLGLLTPPGEYNADIVVAEGQSLGIPMSYGGPYLGLFATKNEFVRKIPGRLSGITQDLDGKRGFVLTLQTREQQIKREKATSNICTNQGLIMLAATVYMSTMGKEGIAEVAYQSFQKAHYLASKIKELKGYSLISDKPFFKEFLVQTPVPVEEIISASEEAGILPGINTARFPECKQGLLVAVTEKRTKQEMDLFVEVLRKFE